MCNDDVGEQQEKEGKKKILDRAERSTQKYFMNENEIVVHFNAGCIYFSVDFHCTI